MPTQRRPPEAAAVGSSLGSQFSLHDYENGYWPRSFSEAPVLLGDWRFYLLLGIGVTVGHFLLRKPNAITELWHLLLTMVRLRPSDLSPE